MKQSLNLKDLHCRNPKCRAVAGQTDGTDLFFDGKIIPREPIQMKFNCVICGEIIAWESLTRKHLKKPPKKFNFISN